MEERRVPHPLLEQKERRDQNVIETQAPWRCIWQGVYDSFQFVKVYKLLRRNPESRESVKSCVLLNGVLFIGSLAFYQFGMVPFLHLILEYAWNSKSTDSVLSPESQLLLERFLGSLFNITWVFPMFFLAKILNGLYYQRVANASFESFRGASAPGYMDVRNKDLAGWISLMLSDAVYTVVMETVLIIETSLVGMLPYGLYISIIFNCWVTSLYCFEYGWLNAGWSLQARVVYFEKHWAYFLGFGFPFVIATYFMSFLYSTALFSMLFPFFVIIATAATPVPSSYKKSVLSLIPDRLPICTPSRQITSSIMMLLPSPRKSTKQARPQNARTVSS
eukprot:m.45867 g.45867  ORF g.45867 m.45867 type:complete len:334 (+) comp7238_c0_seq1:110-1111(+)